jgi:hypothetical protein
VLGETRGYWSDWAADISEVGIRRGLRGWPPRVRGGERSHGSRGRGTGEGPHRGTLRVLDDFWRLERGKRGGKVKARVKKPSEKESG